jgi:hypothetical protein
VGGTINLKGCKNLTSNIVEVEVRPNRRLQLIFLIACRSTNHPDVFDDVCPTSAIFKILESRISVYKNL